MRTYTHKDIGCFADGSFGESHIRGRLASMVSPYDPDLAHSLRHTPPDDYSDEDEAIALLNEVTCCEGVYFCMVDGDLMLELDDQ